jgi:thiamine kinase-like enzyme
LVREHLPAGTAGEAAAIWHEREALLSAVESAPLCLCHHDLHPANLFADGLRTVLIDWGFLGAGHAGEDVGNLTFDAILDFFVAPGDFAELHDALTEGYLDGLADSLLFDADVVLRAIWASGAVKYFWIPLAMVDAVQQGRTTLNRRPLEDAFATWAKVVPGIFGLAHRAK